MCSEVKNSRICLFLFGGWEIIIFGVCFFRLAKLDHLFLFSFFRYGATRAVVIAIACTFFEFFNIPVFWPILVMYFIVLFIITMKRQIKVRGIAFWPKTTCTAFILFSSFYLQHMIRYRYLPFTYGKQKYKGKDESSDVMKS